MRRVDLRPKPSASLHTVEQLRAWRELGVSRPPAPAAKARQRRAAAQRPSPRPVITGGTQPGEQVAVVDWLNVTFEYVTVEHEFGPEKIVVPRWGPDEIFEALSELMGGRFVASDKQGGGIFGFEHGVRLVAYAGGCMRKFGYFCWGGEGQRGRAMLQLSGEGCRLIDDWQAMRVFVEGLPRYRITRCDLAVDLHEGEFTIDECVEWVRDGGFQNAGAKTKTHCDGDWMEAVHGRSVYVGEMASGKRLCWYEKGKQLGDLSSPWNRVEVRFGNQDREDERGENSLSIRMLTERDAFFVGAYPALQALMDVCGDKTKTVREITRITLAKAMGYLQDAYGKYVNFAVTNGVSSADLVEAIRVRAVPTRLTLGSVADPGLASAVHEVFERRAA